MPGAMHRMGVYLGSGEGSDEFYVLVRGLAHASPKDGPGRVDTGEFTRVMLKWMDGPREGEQEMYTPAGHVADTFALDGPNLACQTACAASWSGHSSKDPSKRSHPNHAGCLLGVAHAGAVHGRTDPHGGKGK